MDRVALHSLLAVALLLLAGCQSTTGPVTHSPGTETAGPDRLGWEGGYGHDESIPVNASDGLDDDELDAVLARTMARVEYLRGVEFEKPIDASVISRQEYRTRFGEDEMSGERRAAENATFEALFLVGESEDAVAANRGTVRSVVVGVYDPEQDEILLVTSSGEPSVSEPILAHELVHALQFRRFGVRDIAPNTTDGGFAVDGVIEGDASYLQLLYADRCGVDWSCVAAHGYTGGGGDFRFELYYLAYFPYSDGPVFVRRAHRARGWDGVRRLYDEPPASTEQVIHPDKYPDDGPRDVRLGDASSAAWSPVTPADRSWPNTLGQAAVAAMFVHPAFDTRPGLVVPADDLLYRNGSRLRRLDPFEYGFAYAAGWDGDAFRVYEDDDGHLAYVWRIAWDSPADAQEFADGYRQLLAYWGAERVDGPGERWLIPEGESDYADAFSVRVDGDTVTIVNAPTMGELTDVHAGGRDR